jgi:hypothetical protein
MTKDKGQIALRNQRQIRSYLRDPSFFLAANTV